MHQEGIIPLDLQPFAGPGSPALDMETSLVGAAMEQLEEDLGQPMRWGDGTWAVRCAPCNFCFPNLKQYR